MRVAIFVLLGCLGCDAEARKAAASAQPAVAASTEEEEIETVDDTIPAEDEQPERPAPDEEVDDEEDHKGACAPKDPKLKPMQVLRFNFTDGIEGRDPKSKLSVAKAGQRVYAHLAMRNRSGRERCLHLTFRVGGKKRTSVTLKIGKSWEWRTYAYNTLRADDNRPLELTVTDDQGALVLKKLLAVIPKKKAG